MRAALYEHTGPARQVLHVEEIEAPEPGAGQVRVRISVSGVNPTDYKARSGAVPRPIDGFQVPHHDGAGVIEAVGEGVDPSRVGQRVWLFFAAVGRWGTAAQYCVVPAENAVALADTVSDELGASLGVPAVTAHHCLTADGPLAGACVLVAGGAGAVGHFAIELAKHQGARVAATVGNEENAELARAAGADLVVDYRAADALEQLRAWSTRMDRVVEVALGANLELDLQLAGPGTTIVAYAASGDDPTLPVRKCMTANVVIRFVLLYGVPRDDLMRSVRAVAEAADAGALSELPVHRFGLEDIAAAHELAESGASGKTLIDLT